MPEGGMTYNEAKVLILGSFGGVFLVAIMAPFVEVGALSHIMTALIFIAYLAVVGVAAVVF